MQSMLVRLVLALALALVPSLAFASDFIPLPEVGGKNKQIEIRFVRYTGGSSGKMIVDIRNKSPKRATFKAKGLFFVPQGDAERAPQRLGAAGPFETQGQQMDSIQLTAGATKRLLSLTRRSGFQLPPTLAIPSPPSPILRAPLMVG